MKNIVLYAPPAAGKGTECEYLVKDFGYEVISIGQVLRNARNPETEVGRIIIEKQKYIFSSHIYGNARRRNNNLY